MSEFDELDAMKKIAAALEPLDDAARARALQWASARFRNTKSVVSFDQPPSRGLEIASGPSVSNEYASFAELFDAANPITERDKALVAAFWTQVCENVSAFPAQSLNTLLKDLGHGIANITEALTTLRNEKPALVLQLKKAGTTQQARKTYKLTQEGAKRVAAMTKASFSTKELA
ncbi:hypothetical protein [Tardiphaga sp.]|uniref:hypothetical protein n=1 Tax=Tardiphaga sp. TaxID=1926292 RepID=UPI00263A2ABA|nr:hypothetical protein [Tardiphaga sp.]MDB5620491.1 hypothetical protein [Tardiphaga sp.]